LCRGHRVAQQRDQLGVALELRRRHAQWRAARRGFFVVCAIGREIDVGRGAELVENKKREHALTNGSGVLRAPKPYTAAPFSRRCITQPA